MMFSLCVHAASPSFPEELTLEYEKNGYNCYTITGENVPNVKKAKIKNLKSSNKTVATVTYSSYTINSYKTVYPSIDLKLKKAAKCTISFDLVYGNTKKHFKVKINGVKYISPLKAIKINGKSYTSKFKERSQNTITFTNGKKYNFDVTPNPGWTLESINICGKKRNKTYHTITAFKVYKSDYYLAFNFRSDDMIHYSTIFINVK